MICKEIYFILFQKNSFVDIVAPLNWQKLVTKRNNN